MFHSLFISVLLCPDGEWDEEDGEEWEWEEDEEAVEDEPDTKKSNTNGVLLPKTNGIDHTQNEDDDDDSKPVDAKGVPDIKIQGNVLKIDRKDVVWSDDEYEEDDEEEEEDEKAAKGLLGSSSSKIPVPPPPPPPPPMANGSLIPPPPPLPPGARSPSRGGLIIPGKITVFISLFYLLFINFIFAKYRDHV